MGTVIVEIILLPYAFYCYFNCVTIVKAIITAAALSRCFIE